MKNIAGMHIIMVGGSGGMGSATAKQLAKSGAKISVCSVDQAGLDRLEGELKALGAETYFKYCTNTVPGDVKAFIDESVAKFGAADVLINFAGLSTNATLDTLTEDNWDLVMDVNLKGCFFACQAFSQHVDPEKGALVINFASMACKRPTGLNPHYAAAKAAVNTLTTALSNGMKSKNIKFTIMSPGPTSTTFFAGRKTADQMVSFMEAQDIAEMLEYIIVRSDRLVFHEIAMDSYAYFHG